ncbi:MAG: CPBP family intramembrane metalloprotease [Acidobacteria bacterium]|nr:CPBP family intramembrane metalloprotease [Acidobacteriota bacterium]
MKIRGVIAAAFSFALLIAAIWWGARQSAMASVLGHSFARAFLSFALLFAPLWFSAFGLIEMLKPLPSRMKILGAAALALPYFALCLGTPALEWRASLIVIAFPVLLAAFVGRAATPSRMTWRDGTALAIIAAAYFLNWLAPAWPSPRLNLLPKLFLADTAVYCFLVVRRLEGAGEQLIPTRSALLVGTREWAFYAPIAIVFGEATGFLHFHAALPGAAKLIAAVVYTFSLIALPEEFFFRAILQNFLETRLGREPALFLAALLFGLSHFHHGAVFNGRYVLLAAIAGYFYGRAWRANRELLPALLTHTAVDVAWSLWFR